MHCSMHPVKGKHTVLVMADSQAHSLQTSLNAEGAAPIQVNFVHLAFTAAMSGLLLSSCSSCCSQQGLEVAGFLLLNVVHATDLSIAPPSKAPGPWLL